ncbi:MAG: hypothetical protein HC896_13885, partial [Bacteroidales bacterium]|nr:hypothetical protein [Bacteroidales bacterium]
AECFINAMLTLRVSYDIEQRLLRDMFRFSEFAGAHPGMQHVGGVPKGGTFVLVNTTVIDPEIERFIRGSRKLQMDNRFGNVASVNAAGISRYVDENASHVVVGDFALPYICCDGDSLIEPFIIMVPDKFCHADDKKYEIFTYPRGGVVKGSIVGADGVFAGLPPYVSYDSTMQKYFFHPGLVSFQGAFANLELSYQVGGLSAKTQANVYQKPPEAGFEVETTPVYNENRLLFAQRIRLTAFSSGGNFEHYWLIDGATVQGNSTDTLESTFYYRNKTQYVITYVSVNGVCETRTDYYLRLCEQIKVVNMDFEGVPQFSENPEEDQSVVVLVSPQGGSFKMKNEDGIYFEPEIKISTVVDDNGNQNLQYVLVNSVENPLPAGRFFLSYNLPVCGLESNPHDFFVQSDPVIVIKRYAFVNNDKERYQVYVHPANAELAITGQTGLIKEGGQYFFVPSAITGFTNNKASVTISTRLPGTKQASQVLTIYQVPTQILEVQAPVPVYNENERCQLQQLPVCVQCQCRACPKV